MRELALNWYSLLNTLYATVAGPLRELADGMGVPILSALLFGVIGATSPCQLSTGASALAFVARDTEDRHLVAARAMAYLLGKALVYTLLGVAVILVGRQLAQGSIPVIVVARKILGPLMLLLGLYLLGLIPLRFSLGHGLAGWLQTRAGAGAGGAFLLGTAFSFAFCPTLFLLFFGLTIPLALSSPFGVIYPSVFALGTTLPLLGLVGLLTAGLGLSKSYLRGARRLDAWIRPLAAAVLILAGFNDTLVYWFI